ncbi:hypothetical protein AABM34_20310 [Lysinibacillus fusiformis]
MLQKNNRSGQNDKHKQNLKTEISKQMNTTMVEMNKIIDLVQQTQQEMQKEMNQRFDAVENRLEKVEK